MSDYAIIVKDLKIRYSVKGSTSLKKALGKKEKPGASGRGASRNRNKKKYFEAVKGISFAVEKGEILGIIGENGCGKSTTLRAIAGIYSPDEGIVETFDNQVALMAIGIGFNGELSGRDNILLSGSLLGISEKDMLGYMDSIIEFSGLKDFIDKPVRTYSSGMHSKLAFAITAAIEPDVMLLDEVLSVGDQAFKKKSLAKMKELIGHEDRTVVIVSHSISTLAQLCDRVMWMHEGRIVKIGDPKEVLRQYRSFMEGKDKCGAK